MLPQKVYNQRDESQELALRFINVLSAMDRISIYKHMPYEDLLGLNINQIRALVIIDDRPGITQKEMADILEIKPSSVSVAMRQLVEHNLIERIPDKQDGRIMRLYLATHGQQVLHNIIAVQADLMKELLSVVPLDRQRDMIELLERALAAYHRRAGDKANGDTPGA